MNLCRSSWMVAMLTLLLATRATANEPAPTRSSDVLEALVQPLDAMTWNRLDIRDGKLSLIASAADPDASSRALSQLPLLSHAQRTEFTAAEADSRGPRDFTLTADIVGWPDPSAHRVHATPTELAALDANAKAIAVQSGCALVSELQIPAEASMYRWRCPTDLRGVSRLVSALEGASGGVCVRDFSVYARSAQADSKPSMELKLTVAPCQVAPPAQ